MARLATADAVLWDGGAWGVSSISRRDPRRPTSNDSPAAGTFQNPLYHGADPYIVRHGDAYYSINAGPGGRLEVWKSDSLTRRGRRQIVWAPSRFGWNRAQVWAPELHRLRGRWYIYYSASSGSNATHRMGVLESVGDDPQGPYVDKGQLYTGDHPDTLRHNRWAIDGTVLELRGKLFFLWSGWEDHRDIQHLYIAEMSDPCTIVGQRTRLCPNNCHEWERVGESPWQRGLHEAPQVLRRNGKVFLIYSCSGSWEPTYKLGMLWMDDCADPLDNRSWTKSSRPAFQSTGDVFGVGHCCFTQSPDGREDWIVYHAKTYRNHGWNDRVVRAQPFTWGADGEPVFGQPVPAGATMRMPSEWPEHAERRERSPMSIDGHSSTATMHGGILPPGAAASARPLDA